jgi:flagellar hook-basal body complex protein FliE
MDQPFAPIKGISQQIEPIQNLNPVQSFGGAKSLGEDGEKKQLNFGSVIASQIKGVNTSLWEADDIKNKLVRGEVTNTHDVAISGMKAGIMLRLTTAICSKVSSACTTLFQMQI